MKQIAAIFSKDVRHLWPEIAVSFALLVALVLEYPTTWRSGLSASAGFSSFALLAIGRLPQFLVVLIPISWWFLTARLIHTERLVGDTQFWLTRPYEWPKFLAAKLLFLACFICVPFLLSQGVLLGEAGFNPFPSTAAMLANLFAVTCILVLPLVTLSTVTSSFGKLVLVLLGVFLFFAAQVALLPSHSAGLPDPGLDVSFFIFFAGCVAAIVVQFAMRNLPLACLLIAAVPALLCILGLLPLDSTDRQFPEQSTGLPVKFAYVPSDTHQPAAIAATKSSDVVVMIPVEVSGIPEGEAVTIVSTRATIEAPTGGQWKSPWKSVGMDQKFRPGLFDSTQQFAMPRGIYDKLKGQPVRLHLSIAFELEHETSSTTMPLPDSDFAVNGLGICTPDSPWADGKIVVIHCRSAMRRPHLTYVSALWTEGDCVHPQSDAETWRGEGWSGSTDPDSWNFGLVSVWETYLNLSNSWGFTHSDRPPRSRHLCVGSPITFSRYEAVRQNQTSLAVDNFQLPELSHGGYRGNVAVHLR